MKSKYEQLIKDMEACEQTKGMSVLQHGKLVNNYYVDLINHLRSGTPLKYEWRLPEWLVINKDKILSNVYADHTMGRYQVNHDCGKPYCRVVDDEGKVHFPDHANVSYEVWKKIFPDDTIVQNLIKMDMDIHTLKSEGIEEFSKRPEAVSLIVTGLSEIHANASMFGGIESTSFKIKWKQIDKRGRQVLDLIKPPKTCPMF
jgi:hypothetical protein